MGREIEAVERALERALKKRRRIRAAQRKEIRPLDKEISRLQDALRGLRGRRNRTLAVQAGPKAMRIVADLLAENGPMRQADIARDAYGEDGRKVYDANVSYALRALVESGEVVDTGRVEQGSRVFRLRARRRRAAA